MSLPFGSKVAWPFGLPRFRPRDPCPQWGRGGALPPPRELAGQQGQRLPRGCPSSGFTTACTSESCGLRPVLPRHTLQTVSFPPPVMLGPLRRGLSGSVLGHGHGLLAWPRLSGTCGQCAQWQQSRRSTCG